MSKLKLETKHEINRMRVYRERNRVLLSMGFKSYKEYLASPLWISIRNGFLEDNKVCFGCGGDATEVHHRCYTKKVLSGRGRNHMYPVCRSCHERIEFRDRDGMKLSPRQATNKLKQIARRRA